MLSPPLQNSAAPNEPPELEKVLKWQQERQLKRLHGEYESAVVHLSEIINTNLDAPLILSGVRVEGANNTRDAFLGSLVAPLLPSPTGSTLSSVLTSARTISDRLLSTDIFASLSASLQPAESPTASPYDVDLVLKTKEKGRFFLKSSTEVGNNEGNASLTGRIRNVFGGAEVLEGNISLGTTTKRAFNASLSAPLLVLSPDLRTHGELSVYGTQSDLSAWSSCVCAVRGLKVAIRRGHHEIAYEAALRNIGTLSPAASLSIRQLSGSSLKSALSHTYALSSYLSSPTPSTPTPPAAYIKLTHELSGLGGNASFFRHQFDGRVEAELGQGFGLSLSTRTGLIVPVASPSSPNGSIPFPDRFQLGGPLSVRAFGTNGMGVRDGSDSLGGTLFYSAGLSLFSPIPRKSHWPLKLHTWINAGLLSDPFSDTPNLTLDKIKNLSGPSISAGVGLVYNLPIAPPAAVSSPSAPGTQPARPVRLELNFGVPLVMARNESARRGLQVGIGMEFL